ncbi:MAG: addiction module protein [Chloroflexota bacterium]|nr:addiction module protein [Chloroflexota bacterium]
MTPTLTQILQLSVPERIQLVEDIWDSILASPESLKLTEVQKQVLDRRLQSYRQQPESSIPWEEVKKQIRSLA